jgi:hypothetical protein
LTVTKIDTNSQEPASLYLLPGIDPMNLDHGGKKNNYEQPSSYTCAEKHGLEQILLANLKAHHVELLDLLGDHAYEDTVYRFYSGSFKHYQHAPQWTAEIVAALQRLAPRCTKLCL